MVGQCLGAGKTERVPRIISFSFCVNLIFGVIFTVFTVIFPRQIFGLFSTDSDVLEMAMMFIPCAILSYFGFAFRTPLLALINGVGHAKLNLIVGLLDGVVCRIGLAILLGISFGMGVRGFWYGNVLAGYVPFVIGMVYFYSGKWKTRTLLISG